MWRWRMRWGRLKECTPGGEDRIARQRRSRDPCVLETEAVKRAAMIRLALRQRRLPTVTRRGWSGEAGLRLKG